MNILHVFNSDSGGGVGGTLEFINYCEKSYPNFKHFIILPSGSSKNKIKNILSSKSNSHLFTVPLHWWNKKTNHSFIYNIFIEIFGQVNTVFHLKSIIIIRNIIIKNKIDIVYTTTSCIKSGAIAARISSIPHLWHIKERVGENGFMKFYHKDEKLINIFFKNSTYIVAMSNYAGELFKKYGDNDRFKVVYDGLNIDSYISKDFKTKGMELRKKYGVKADDILIGNIGSLGSHVKRHDLFIDAAIKTLKNHNKDKIKFIMYGSLPKKSKYFKKVTYTNYLNFRKKIIKNKLENKIIFAGHHNHIPSIINSIDILVHTCDKEGFGRVLIETMSNSLPIICPDKGGASEIVKDLSTGLQFKSSNLKDLIEKLNTLILNKGLRKEYGDNGFELLKSKFTIKKHASSIVSIIKNLVRS